MVERYNLLKLSNACDDAIQLANAAEIKGEAVNYGDLSCVDARYWESIHGDSGHMVLIEEAAPDNYNFRKFITEKLTEAGFPDVEVETAW